MAKIFHVYLFRGILFSVFSISMKIFEQELFFSSVNEEVYSEVYHLLSYYFPNYYLVGQYRQNARILKRNR